MIENNKTRNIIAIGLVMLFGVLAYLMDGGMLLGLDEQRFVIYSYRTEAMNNLFIFITHLGDWKTVTSIGVLLIVFKRTRESFGIPLLVTTGISVFIYSVLKVAFLRDRPDEIYRLITQGGYSFPSGHSMNCMVFYGTLIYLIWKNFSVAGKKSLSKATLLAITIPMGGLIMAIGFSRIYLGVHFPSDVLAGWNLGLAIVIFAIGYIDKYHCEKNV